MSNIRATTISDSAGTGPITLTGQYAAKAWANIDQTGTPSINGSGNVSSVTDVSLGHTTINFSNAMSDANFSCVASAKGSNARVNTTTKDFTTSSALVRNYQIYSGEGYKDENPVSASVIGDLA